MRRHPRTGSGQSSEYQLHRVLMIDRYILSSRDQRHSEQEKAQVTCVFFEQLLYSNHGHHGDGQPRQWLRKIVQPPLTRTARRATGRQEPK
ncbi:hypothetical protein EMIT0196P_30292 [Pseudomonas chlororaphis]